MNFALYIAKRYLRTASKSNAINIINGIASLSIIVGAAALFVVLSVFSGLKEFSLSFSNDFDPDLKVMPVRGKTIDVPAEKWAQIQNIEGVAAAAKSVEERVLFVFDGKEQVAYLKGVDEDYTRVNPVDDAIFQGMWLNKNSSQVVAGYGISNNLALGLLDFNHPFEVFVPKPGKGAIDHPEDGFTKAVLQPVGIFAISEELDAKYVFSDLSFAQYLLSYKPEKVSAIELKKKPGANESRIASEIQKILPEVRVRNRAQLNESLYRMLNTENIAVYLIFTLVLIVALFNLVGALIMMIIEKRQNLKTMLALGADPDVMRRIFRLQGTLLSFVGGIVGIAIGIVIVVIQQQFQVVMITPTLAYPVIFSIWNALLVFATIVVLGFLASVVASSRVNAKLLSAD